MTQYFWYATPVDRFGTSTAPSQLVRVWVDTNPPPSGSGSFDLVILDSNGDGLVSRAEWGVATGGGSGLNSGSATRLFDGIPGGGGVLYSNTSFLVGSLNLLAGMSNSFSPVSPVVLDPNPPCFVRGTRFSTKTGKRPIEELVTGDYVKARGGVFRKVVSIASRCVGADYLAAKRDARPIKIAANAFRKGSPARDLLLSRQHRIFIPKSRAGDSPALVAAHYLLGLPGVSIVEHLSPVEYFHLILEEHYVVRAENILVESLLVTERAIAMLKASDVDANCLRLSSPYCQIVTGQAARDLVRVAFADMSQ